MAELLLELFSEEIPARMQARAAEELQRLVCDGLKGAGLSFDNAEAYVTPRRLALVVDGLPDRQPDVSEERRGPRVGAPDQAIAGFLKANGMSSVDQCEKRDTGKGEFWFAVIDRKGRETVEVLPELLAKAVEGLAWPKSMRWGTGSMRWVRSLQRVLCIFDGNVPGLKLGDGLLAGKVTSGHRFMAPEPFKVTSFAQYRDELKKRFVVLDAAERQRLIVEQATALAEAEGLSLRDDPALLAEVAGLVEWPVALMGRIDDAFMAVPDEVLTTSMRSHQKYFAVTGKDGTLAPRFIVIANIEAPDQGTAIVAGNERVLRARLSDARFFWDQDKKTRLEERVPDLEQIIFHAKLGTLGDKVARVQTLAGELADDIPGCDRDQARSAALLAKADLTTQMVYEFPELQGIMGRYYALEEGERPEIADAIAQHYSPLGPGDICPTAPLSVAVALADKLDTLVGFWAIDEKPTGSKDPYALRRAALGVIRLILENKLRLPLRHAFTLAGRGLAGVSGNAAADAVVADLLAFFADRLKVHLREQGVRHDLITAVFSLTGEDDLVRLLARVEALRAFLGSDDGANLLTAYRRAANIVGIEEKKDGVRHDGAADPAAMVEPDERALADALGQVEGSMRPLIDAEDFGAAMGVLAGLRQPVDAFFDKVTVNSDDAKLRNNRLRLLAQIRTTVNTVADFSQIEG